MSNLLWISKGSDYGWVATPPMNSPAGGIKTNVSLVTKFYIASFSTKDMTMYIGVTDSPYTTATSTVTGTSTSSNKTSSTSDLRTFNTTGLSLTAGTKYISINHNHTTGGITSYFYLYSYSCLYQ